MNSKTFQDLLMICFLMVSQRVDMDSVCFSFFLNFLLFFFVLQIRFSGCKLHFTVKRKMNSLLLFDVFAVGHEDLFRVFALGGLFAPIVTLVQVVLLVDRFGGYRRRTLECTKIEFCNMKYSDSGSLFPKNSICENVCLLFQKGY